MSVWSNWMEIELDGRDVRDWFQISDERGWKQSGPSRWCCLGPFLEEFSQASQTWLLSQPGKRLWPIMRNATLFICHRTERDLFTAQTLCKHNTRWAGVTHRRQKNVYTDQTRNYADSLQDTTLGHLLLNCYFADAEDAIFVNNRYTKPERYIKNFDAMLFKMHKQW